MEERFALAPNLDARLIHLCMHGRPTQGVQVVVEGLFEVDRPTLARAVGPVRQGRQRRLAVHLPGCAGSALRRTDRPSMTTKCPSTTSWQAMAASTASAGQLGA
jgi:hypothetical protein